MRYPAALAAALGTALALVSPTPLNASAQSPASGGPPFVPLPGVGEPFGIQDVGGRLFFAALQPATGNEPWFSAYPDGPSYLLGDLNPGTNHGCHSGDPEFIAPVGLGAIEFGAKVLFSTHAGIGGQGEGNLVNLWTSDGTPGGTQLLRTFDKPGGTFNYGYTVTGVALGEKAVFGAYTDVGGWRLWRTDGTALGTEPVLAMATVPGGFTRVGNFALFSGSTPANGFQLWRTDGTASGTAPVANLNVYLGYPSRTAVLDGVMYFAARQAGDDVELWKSDGTPAGTQRVKDILPGSVGSYPENLIRVGDRVYFSAIDAAFGRELWRSDGTEAGTVRLTDLNAGPTYTNLEELTEAGGRLFFHAKVGANGRVYRYDPVSGPVELGVFVGVSAPDVPQHIAYDFIHDMVAIGTRRVLFSARDEAKLGDELWITDGTPAGTELYADLAPGSLYGGPVGMTLANGQIFLRPGNTGSGLAKTLYAAPAGATADTIGTGCAASGWLPRLTATDPVLGGQTRIHVRGAQPNSFALVLRGVPSAPLGLGFGCTAYFDASSVAVLGAGNVGPTGNLILPPITLPNLAALDGFQFTLQAAVGPTATQPIGFDFSNAVLMTLGS